MVFVWIFAALAALALLPIGVRGIYAKGGVIIRLLVGPVSIPVYPRKKNMRKEKKTKQEDKRSKNKTNKPHEKQEGGKLTDFLPLVQIALDFLGDFRKKIRVRCLKMQLTLAGGEPDDLALNYGKAWTALGNLMPWLERLFVIGKRDLQIACDFTAEESTLYVRGDATITVGRLLSLLVRYGYRGYKEYKKINNKNKAVHEK